MMSHTPSGVIRYTAPLLLRRSSRAVVVSVWPPDGSTMLTDVTSVVTTGTGAADGARDVSGRAGSRGRASVVERPLRAAT